MDWLGHITRAPVPKSIERFDKDFHKLIVPRWTMWHCEDDCGPWGVNLRQRIDFLEDDLIIYVAGCALVPSFLDGGEALKGRCGPF